MNRMVVNAAKPQGSGMKRVVERIVDCCGESKADAMILSESVMDTAYQIGRRIREGYDCYLRSPCHGDRRKPLSFADYRSATVTVLAMFLEEQAACHDALAADRLKACRDLAR